MVDGENGVDLEVLESDDNKKSGIDLSIKFSNYSVFQILGLDNWITSNDFPGLIDCLNERRKMINKNITDGEADDYGNAAESNKAA